MIMIYHISVCRTLEKGSPFFMGKESIGYYIENRANSDDVLESFKEIGINGALYRLDNYEGSRIIELFYKGDYVDMPMKNGHFLNRKEIESKEPVAVVGAGHVDKIKYEGNKPYISLNDSLYRVVGILGMNDPTFFDDFIYTNYLADKSDLVNEVVEIDYFVATNGQDFLNRLLEKSIDAKFAGYGMTNDNFGLLNDLKYIKYFALLLLCIGISIFMSMSFYMNSKMKEVAIRRMVGGSVEKVITHYAFELLTYISLSFLICFIVSAIWFKRYIRYMIWGYMITVPFLLLMIVIAVAKETKRNISEAYY